MAKIMKNVILNAITTGALIALVISIFMVEADTSAAAMLMIPSALWCTTFYCVNYL